MGDTATASLMKATSRTAAANVGRMTDDQLIALRGIFQAIDANNNGSITPSLLTKFYSQEGVAMDIRAVEDLFDQLGAEHSLPFRRFLVYAPAIVAKLPSESKWRLHEKAASTEPAAGADVSAPGKDPSAPGTPKAAALRETNQQLNRQIVDRQAKLDRINEDIATGEATLAAINLKIQAATAQLAAIEQQIGQKETALDTYNLVQIVKPRTPKSTEATPMPLPQIEVQSTEEHDSNDDASPVSPSKKALEHSHPAHSEPAAEASYKEPTPDATEPVSATNVETASDQESADSTPRSPKHVEPAPANEPHHELADEKPVEKPADEKSDEHDEVENVTSASTESLSASQAAPEPEAPKPAAEVNIVVENVKEPAHTKEHTKEDAKDAHKVGKETPPARSEESEETTPRGEPHVDLESSISSRSGSTVDLPAISASTGTETEESDDHGAKKHKKRKDKKSTSRMALLEPEPVTSPKSRKHKDKEGDREKEKEKEKAKEKTKDKVKESPAEKEKPKDKEREKEKDKDKDKEDKEKRKTRRSPSVKNNTAAVASTKTPSREPEPSIALDLGVMNASATGNDPLRSPAKRGESLSTETKEVAPSTSPRRIEELPLGEKIAIIDKTFFASVDVKLQAIIDGLQPLQHLLDLSYFNLIVYIQGLNMQLSGVATKVPTVSTVPTNLSTGIIGSTGAGKTKSGLFALADLVGTPRRDSTKAPILPISPSSPTPPVVTTVRSPVLGYNVSGPYFTLPTGDMLNGLGDALVQCLNTLLISIQDSRTKTPTLLASLCSSWKSHLYRHVCSAYHSMRNLIGGVCSDPAQYFFPASPPPADDPTLDRPMNSIFAQISMPPTNVNDEYMPDRVALDALAAQQQTDAQLLPREEFNRLFGVYFGDSSTENLLYILDPWATQSVPMKRFAEFLRLFGSVAAGTCYRNLQIIANTPGFQGYLTESVVLTLLDQQKPGTYCLWYNKVRPKFGILNLSWYDSDREVVSTTAITISSTVLEGHSEVNFSFGFDYEGISVTAPTLLELLHSLSTLPENPPISAAYSPQFPRSSVFHGDMDSPEAESVLSKESDGTLLFRLSSRRGSIAVSYVFRGKVGHTLLKVGNPDTYEYSGQVYNSIEDVIKGHSQIFKFVFDCSTLARTDSPSPKRYL